MLKYIICIVVGLIGLNNYGFAQFRDFEIVAGLGRGRLLLTSPSSGDIRDQVNDMMVYSTSIDVGVRLPVLNFKTSNLAVGASYAYSKVASRKFDNTSRTVTPQYLLANDNYLFHQLEVGVEYRHFLKKLSMPGMFFSAQLGISILLEDVHRRDNFETPRSEVGIQTNFGGQTLSTPSTNYYLEIGVGKEFAVLNGRRMAVYPSAKFYVQPVELIEVGDNIRSFGQLGTPVSGRNFQFSLTTSLQLFR